MTADILEYRRFTFPDTDDAIRVDLHPFKPGRPARPIRIQAPKELSTPEAEALARLLLAACKAAEGMA